MIYTLTFNPALDYTMQLKTFVPGAINRSVSEEIYCGGKGINVSYVLNTLGHKSTVLGFIAGFVGDEIENKLTEAGINCAFTKVINGCSRINVKLRYDSETDINGMGPEISAEDTARLFQAVDKIGDGDFLVIAGSVPSGVDSDIYAKLSMRLQNKGVKLVADTTGSLLLNILKYKPFLIKPNREELEELFDVKISSVEDVCKYALKLKEMGAVNVLVSMAEKGSVLVDEFSEIHVRDAAKGTLVNSVGAGDSMVAGFIAGYIESGSYERAHILGSAAGSATAFSEWLADKKSIVTLC